MFLGVFRFSENMKFVLKGRIRCIFQVSPGHVKINALVLTGRTDRR